MLIVEIILAVIVAALVFVLWCCLKVGGDADKSEGWRRKDD
jgi:hypothetical protein